MFRRTWLVALLVVPILTMASIACGNGEKGSAPAGTATNVGTPTPTIGATPTATAAVTTTPTTTPTTTATPTPTAAPSPIPGRPLLEIVAPSTNVPVPRGNLNVEARVVNFNLLDKLDQPNVLGEGHLHFYLLGAGDVVPTTPGQPAFTAQGTYHAQAGTSYTWPDVQPGTYKVAVQVVNNDHTPLTPPAVQAVLVQVQ